MNEQNILIYIEKKDDKTLTDVALELGSYALELSKKLDNSKVIGLLIGENIDYSDVLHELPKYGFDEAYVVKDDRLKRYSTKYYSKITMDLIEKIKPHIFLVGATRIGRDLAPSVSSKLELGLVADCVGLQINAEKKLEATRPTFGDNLMATIVSETYPQMATIRPNTFDKAEQSNPQKSLKVHVLESNIDGIEDKVELLDFKLKELSCDEDLKNAEIIIAGGMGMKSKEGFDLLHELAVLLNAKVGATRLAVEADFAPHNAQIGQTGITVAPRIYIACGISGALQHQVGMDKSTTIIAVNNDKNAQIHEIATYSIVEDVFEIIHKWIELKTNSKG